MKSRSSQEARIQLVGMLLIAAAGTAAFWIADGLASAWPSALILFGFVALVHLGRTRSDAVAAISGVGDERTQLLNQRAAAATAYVLSLVLPAWFFVSLATGEANTTVAVLCAVAGATYLLSAVAYARAS
jgi:TctA family transporter